MSSNMVYKRVYDNMLTIGLTTAESIIDNWLNTSSERELSMIEVLDHLFEQEISIKRGSAIRTRTKVTGFPVKKYLKDSDFDFQKSIDRKVIDELRTLRSIHNQENLILLGTHGVGKTHISIGLGMEAIEAGFSVYFINSANMISRLKTSAERGNL